MEKIIYNNMDNDTMYEYELNNFVDFLEDSWFIATGTCGRWDGTYDGGFVFTGYKGLMEFFEDCDQIKIWEEKGHLYVLGYHHDGRNYVEIKVLTDQGKRRYEGWQRYRWESMRETFTKIFTGSHYSRLPRYFKTI